MENIFITLSIIVLGYIAYEDAKTKLIDDRVVLAGMCLLYPFAILLFGFAKPTLGAIAGFSLSFSLYAIAWLMAKMTGQESFGGGDVTVSVLMGTVCGWQAVIFVFLFAFFLQLFIALPVCAFKRNLRTEVPFVPAYFLSYCLHLLFVVKYGVGYYALLWAEINVYLSAVLH